MATSKAIPTETSKAIPTEKKEVVKSVSVAQPQGEKIVSFIPTQSGKALVSQVEYIFFEGKEIKIPDAIAGILTHAKKGHKK